MAGRSRPAGALILTRARREGCKVSEFDAASLQADLPAHRGGGGDGHRAAAGRLQPNIKEAVRDLLGMSVVYS